MKDFRKKIYKNVNQIIINKENAIIYEKELTVSLQKSETLQEIFENVEHATKYCNEKETKPSYKPFFPQEIKELTRKREKLKTKKRNIKEKIELNLICKIIATKIRENKKKKQNELIEGILETTRSIRTIKKERTIGQNWLTYILDKEGNRIYNRRAINNPVDKNRQHFAALCREERQFPQRKN